MTADPSATTVVSFEDFVAAIASIIDCEVESVHKEDLIIADLAFDSMDMVELVAAMAPYFGTDVPVEEDWSLLTVGDLYTAFVVSRIDLPPKGVPRLTR